MNSIYRRTEKWEAADKCAKLLDECSSESEFRLKCQAWGEDPEKVFEPYAWAVGQVRGYASIGLALPKFKLSDWWAFEKIPGANKPDPWMIAYRYSPAKCKALPRVR